MKRKKTSGDFAKFINNNWEYPACNNCNAKTFEVFLKDISYWQYPGTFRLVRCSVCSLIYLHPRPSISEIGQYYPHDSYWGQDIAQSFLASDWKKERAKGYDFLYSGIGSYSKNGAILDIGAGTGMFLSQFKEQGWVTDGVELSKEAVEFARKVFGVKLKLGDFLSFSFKNNHYDVVSLNNVLEHLHQPKETLLAIHPLLKDTGVLVITVPNIESIGMQLFGKKSHLLQPPRHLYQFSEQTLTDMLNLTGYTVKNIDHRYWVHNYYSIFESLRLRFSDKFKDSAGDSTHSVSSNSIHSEFSIKKELQKLVGKCVTLGIVIAELVLRRSEVICVYATKSVNK